MKLLICDDDISTIDVISTHLSWREMGIDELFVAYNGEVAKELILRENPELILCDIGMPKCDGLEVLKFIHDNSIQTEFAFLTCYESFEYARIAIRHKAVNYMTKPFDIGELKDAVRKMIQNAKARIANSGSLEDLPPNDTHVNNMLRQIRDGFYGVDRKRLNRILVTNNFDFTADSAWRLVYITADSTSATDGGWERELLTEGFQRLAEEMLVNNLGSAFTIVDIGERFISLTCFVPAESSTEAELATRCRRFIDLCMTTFTIAPVCLYSDAVSLYLTPEIAPQLHRRITKLRHKAGGLYAYDEHENSASEDVSFVDYDLILRCIRQELKTEFTESIATALNKIIHSRESDANMLVKLHHELIQIMYRCLRDNGIPERIMLDDKIVSKLDMTTEWSLSDFMNFAQSAFDYVVSAIRTANDGENVIMSAKQYIAGHFREDIDRKDVAALTFITPNYFSKRFRAETGVNLREYINQLRIDEAKRLLLTTNMTVSEVAGEIGYDNTSYFSTVFKKLCGVSPNEWRNLAMKEEGK